MIHNNNTVKFFSFQKKNKSKIKMIFSIIENLLTSLENKCRNVIFCHRMKNGNTTKHKKIKILITLFVTLSDLIAST